MVGIRYSKKIPKYSGFKRIFSIKTNIIPKMTSVINNTETDNKKNAINIKKKLSLLFFLYISFGKILNNGIRSTKLSLCINFEPIF